MLGFVDYDDHFWRELCNKRIDRFSGSDRPRWVVGIADADQSSCAIHFREHPSQVMRMLMIEWYCNGLPTELVSVLRDCFERWRCRDHHFPRSQQTGGQ